MAVYLRTKALFLEHEESENPTEEFALAHIQGESPLVGVNESDVDGYIELRYHSGVLTSIKSTMADFDKKLRELGHEIIQ